MPNFHDLPRELRHKILIETFDVAGKTDVDGWTFVNIKTGKHQDLLLSRRTLNFETDIEQWTTVLQAVDDNSAELQEDAGFVAEKWLEELKTARCVREQFFQEGWKETIALDNPRGQGQHAARVWAMNREGEAPWLQVHMYLFEITQFWWLELHGRNTMSARKHLQDGLGSDFIRRQLEKDPQLTVRADHPPWTLYCSHPGSKLEWQVWSLGGKWTGGSSRIEWDRTGGHHVPSTWDILEANGAVKADVAWLAVQLEWYQSSLPEIYHHTKFEYTGVGDRLCWRPQK